jgi:hypothetical protein
MRAPGAVLDRSRRRSRSRIPLRGATLMLLRLRCCRPLRSRRPLGFRVCLKTRRFAMQGARLALLSGHAPQPLTWSFGRGFRRQHVDLYSLRCPRLLQRAP